jgi:hypothetical protein
MEALVGQEFPGRTSFPIDRTDIRKWALAVYYPETPPRIFWDEEYAATTPYGGIVAPEDFNPFAWLSADALTDSGDRPGREFEERVASVSPDLKFALNGGAEVEYTGVRMRPGDVIRSVQSIVNFHERTGRLGLMLFSVREARWFNQQDELIKTQRGIGIRY